MATLKPGTRVRVRIKDKTTWAMGAADALNDTIGTIEEVKGPAYKPMYLVRFDAPAPTWHTHQTPWTAGHFKSHELEIIQ